MQIPLIAENMTMEMEEEDDNSCINIIASADLNDPQQNGSEWMTDCMRVSCLRHIMALPVSEISITSTTTEPTISEGTLIHAAVSTENRLYHSGQRHFFFPQCVVEVEQSKLWLERKLTRIVQDALVMMEDSDDDDSDSDEDESDDEDDYIQ